MSASPQADQPDGAPALRLAGFLILLLFILLGDQRRQLAQAIRLAPPAFVPLASDAAGRFAHEFGTAYAELVEAEQRSEET